MLFFWAQDARTRCQLVKYLPIRVCLPLCLASVSIEKVQQTHWAYHLAACTCAKASEAREQELEEWHALISKDVINNNQAGESWATCCLCSHVPQRRWLAGRRHTLDNRMAAEGMQHISWAVPVTPWGGQVTIPNKKMKDTHQQCCLRFTKLEVNKIQRQNITPQYLSILKWSQMSVQEQADLGT